MTNIQQLIQAEALPANFDGTVERWYQPLAERIAARHCEGKLRVLGVQGSQGSGKSTLASFIKVLLQEQFNTAVLSLDDFYLTRAERKALAAAVHPLLLTRGVPGTHDIDLALNTLQALFKLGAGELFHVPRFNKALDDRFPEKHWDKVRGPVDLIILEGWCLGVEAEAREGLVRPINMLETKEDIDGRWRQFVNAHLGSHYQTLFGLIDYLVVLQAPSFDCVHEWRWLQEKKLLQKWQKENPDHPSRALDAKSVSRFISHYERLTRHCLNTLPQKADCLLHLNEEHEIVSMEFSHAG